MGYIYKITNLITNDLYIGQTVHTIQQRWKDHLDTCFNINNKSNYYILYRAIRKYGVENFKIEQVEECDNSLLNEREIYWIKQFNSYYLNNHGYNMTLGGGGVVKYSDEDILSLWDKGLKSYQIAEQLGANVATIGARLKVLKPGEAQKRHLDSNKKSVLQYNLNGEFIKKWDCIRDAEKELNISQGNITKCCQHKMDFAKDSFWLYEDDDTSITHLMINYALSVKCNAVDLIDKNDKVLKQFTSAAEAERAMGITRGKVSEVCNHKRGRKTAGGYRWQWSYPLKRQIIELNSSK